MAPKAKPAAAKAKGISEAPAAAVSSEARPPPSVADVEAHLAQLPEEDWAELAAVEEPAEPIARALQGVLLLLGYSTAEASSWATTRSVLADVPCLLRQLQALGPWGASEAQLEAASLTLEAASVCQLERPGTADAPTASAGSRAGAAAKAKAPAAKAKAPAAKAAPVAVKAPLLGASAALALGMMAETLVAMRRAGQPPPFPMVWPLVPFAKLHSMLQQAMLTRQAACVLCDEASAYSAAVLYFERSGAALVNIKLLQVRVGLAKTLCADGMRAEIGRVLREAMASGRRCVLLLGDNPPNLRHICDAKQVPIEAFDGEKADEAAKAMDLSGAAPGFHMTILAQSSKEGSSMLARLLPSFDEMAVLLLDFASLPSLETLREKNNQESRPGLQAALQLLVLKPAPPPAIPPAASGEAAEAALSAARSRDAGTSWNTEVFEFVEMFDDSWQDRWSTGPSSSDEFGKPIRANLITSKIVKYPSNPKDAKNCMQLVGGSNNSPCTGIWTTFSPICRPTEIEFEFTITGKVEQPNACLVFTEKAFDGALPDTRVGLQFLVRGGMQLAGAGSLIRISNDGKIKHDKWNKVILRIDWNEKIVIGQVDTQGKGYAPAIQTVPFRDLDCQGFGYVYIYNTDMQGTCWFHSLRIKQGEQVAMEHEALDARAYFVKRAKQKDYDNAVAADMEVGMKMGAIKSTAHNGMNLVQEQAANYASAAGAAM